MLNKENNPYYRMLMRRYKHKLSARWRNRLLWIGLMFPVAALPLLSDLAYILSWGGLYLLLFVPALMATTFAQVCADDTRSANYDLIMLTPLEEKDIVWGHFHSVLDKNLLSGYLPYGQLPLAFTVFSIGIVIATFLRDGFEEVALIALLTTSMSLTGLYWMLGFAGIVVGLAIRRPGVATFLIFVMSLMCIIALGKRCRTFNESR